MSKIFFNSNELDQIKKAVKEAESKTSGEIATAFIHQCDSYASYEMTFAFFTGFIYFMVLMFFVHPIELRMQEIFWGYSASYIVMFYGFTIFVVMAFSYLAANMRWLDRLIIPKKVMARKVNERAVRHFIEAGVCNTRDRTGILIFISFLEQRVELLADKGISDKIPPEKWEYIVSVIIDGMRTGKLTEHITEAIHECGVLLAEHYPIQPDDVNELKDDLHILAR